MKTKEENIQILRSHAEELKSRFGITSYQQRESHIATPFVVISPDLTFENSDVNREGGGA